MPSGEGRHVDTVLIRCIMLGQGWRKKIDADLGSSIRSCLQEQFQHG